MSRPAGEVAVVGSGPSGLAAAYRLHAAGYRVRLLESSDYLGGKLKTVERSGFLVEEGATLLAAGYRTLIETAHAVGMADELVPAGDILSFLSDGRLYEVGASSQLRDGLRTGLLSVGAKLRLWKLGLDIYRARSVLDPADLSLAAAWDTESVQDYARRSFNPEIWERLLDPALRGLVGTSAIPVSKVDLLFSLKTFVGAKYVAFEHGMSSYVQRLAPLFDVSLGATVTGVEARGETVTVSWTDAAGASRREEVAGCVVATPAGAAAEILPGLDAWRREFLENVRYSKMIAINVALSRPPDGVRSSYIQIPSSTGSGIGPITVDHNCAPSRVPAGKGLLSLYSTDEWAARVIDEPDEVIVERAVADAELALPGLGNEIEFTSVSRYPQMVLMSHAGYWRRMAEFHRIRHERDRRIQLAGDYFATSNVNTASAAGARAASDLLAELSCTPGATVLARRPARMTTDHERAR